MAIEKLGSHCSEEKSSRSRLTPISKSPRAGLFNKIELASGWFIGKIGVAHGFSCTGQPLGTKKIMKNPSRQKNRHFSGQKKSCNLLGQKKITQPFRTKKNQATFWSKKKIRQPFGTKKVLQLLGTKKITQSLRTKKNDETFQDKKIMLLTQKESCNLCLGTNKNHATSWDKKIIQPLRT